jgi:hypothetical protein
VAAFRRGDLPTFGILSNGELGNRQGATSKVRNRPARSTIPVPRRFLIDPELAKKIRAWKAGMEEANRLDREEALLSVVWRSSASNWQGAKFFTQQAHLGRPNGLVDYLKERQDFADRQTLEEVRARLNHRSAANPSTSP